MRARLAQAHFERESMANDGWQTKETFAVVAIGVYNNTITLAARATSGDQSEGKISILSLPSYLSIPSVSIGAHYPPSHGERFPPPWRLRLAIFETTLQSSCHCLPS